MFDEAQVSQVDSTLEACIKCCKARNGDVPNCRTCQEGSMAIQGPDGSCRPNWPLYGEFLRHVRSDKHLSTLEYMTALNNSFRRACFLGSNLEQWGYALLDKGVVMNPYYEHGMLYLLSMQDAEEYREATGQQELPIFRYVPTEPSEGPTE